jgi:hypothetical protein
MHHRGNTWHFRAPKHAKRGTSNLKRKHVLSATILQEILDGFRTEQLPEKLAGFPHQWAQRTVHKIGAATGFVCPVQRAVKGCNGPVQQLNDLKHDHFRRTFAKAVPAADAALAGQEPFVAQRQENLFEELHWNIAPT